MVFSMFIPNFVSFCPRFPVAERPLKPFITGCFSVTKSFSAFYSSNKVIPGIYENDGFHAFRVSMLKDKSG